MPGRHLTDRQVRLYMSLRRKDTPSVAAARAAFSTPTAYRIESDPRLPSQKQTPRTRRRRDPLADIFDEEVVPLLVESPSLRAVVVSDVDSRADSRIISERRAEEFPHSAHAARGTSATAGRSVWSTWMGGGGQNGRS